ncbi:MAG TPA: type II secretion system protein [Chthoniobacteraceae bacterium]|nr:type II secretion system protein [Chthoniobacteraceae bacterium]
MHTSSHSRAAAAAFTLVELLTVIAIIAILMGLLFPAIGIVKEQARKVQAKTDVNNIVAAVKTYNTEYGKYPPVQDPPVAGGTDDFVGDPAASATINNNALFNTLRAIAKGVNLTNKFNPRQIVFFEGKRVADSTAPRAGFADGSTDPIVEGNFYDPWGKEYNVVIDSNYDNQIGVDSQYNDFAGNNAPRVGCGAFSLGKDNQLGNKGDKMYKNGTTVSDDVISWQ